MHPLYHPLQVLHQPQKGILVEKNNLFIPVSVAAKGKTTAEIKEETPLRRWVAIDSSKAHQAIRLYLKDPSADPKISASLREALDLQDKVGKLDRELARVRRAKKAFSERQAQVRDNLKLLGKSVRNADLSRKLVATLKKLETDLTEVTRKLVAKDMERSELNDRLTVLIKSISLKAE